MAELASSTPVKALDGTIQPVNGAPTVPTTSLPLRTKPSSSNNAQPTSGQILTGKQEHCKFYFVRSGDMTKAPLDLKRELVSQQVTYEISELASTTALQRFGAPFRSEYGEVAPVDSDLPILRYIFVHHVRNFPFLDQAREKEFWQDKLQVV